jgi:hypothetical protein
MEPFDFEVALERLRGESLRHSSLSNSLHDDKTNTKLP